VFPILAANTIDSVLTNKVLWTIGFKWRSYRNC